MENVTKKIILYKERDFSAKFDDTFAFLRQNYKPLLKFITYLLLPVSLLQAIAMDGYMDTALDMSSVGGAAGIEGLSGMMLSLGGMMVFSVIGSLLLYSVVYAMMYIYEQSTDGIATLAGAELKPVLMRNIRRSLLLMLCYVGLVLAAAILVGALMAIVSYWMVLPAIIGIIIVAIPLSLVMPIYLLEDDTTVGEAFGKSFHLGWPNWWSTLGIMLVMGIIASFAQGVFATPYYIAIVLKSVLGMQQGFDGFGESPMYSFMVYLFSVLQTFATYVLTTMLVVASALQYGHCAEKEDHVSMEDNIERFEQL